MLLSKCAQTFLRLDFDSGSMAVKTETKDKNTIFLDGMMKAKEDNPKLFKKLEKL
jgi:hypothetical protein